MNRNLKRHQDSVKADQLDFILSRVMEKAAALYREWPMIA
jgi:hypothetical protein